MFCSTRRTTCKGCADSFGGSGVIAAAAVGGLADAHPAALAAASAAGESLSVQAATVAATVASAQTANAGTSTGLPRETVRVRIVRLASCRTRGRPWLLTCDPIFRALPDRH